MASNIKKTDFAQRLAVNEGEVAEEIARILTARKITTGRKPNKKMINVVCMRDHEPVQIEFDQSLFTMYAPRLGQRVTGKRLDTTWPSFTVYMLHEVIYDRTWTWPTVPNEPQTVDWAAFAEMLLISDRMDCAALNRALHLALLAFPTRLILSDTFPKITKWVEKHAADRQETFDGFTTALLNDVSAITSAPGRDEPWFSALVEGAPRLFRACRVALQTKGDDRTPEDQLLFDQLPE